MKLRDWIPFEKLDKENLLQNPSAIHLIMDFDENIIKSDFANEKRLFRNSNFMDFLIYKKDKYWVKKDNKWVNEISYIDLFKILFDKIDHLWFTLSKNPSVIDILKEYPDEINWRGLSCNPAAIDLLKANPSKIDWQDLYDNIAAIDLLDNEHEWYWYNLSMNPNGIRLLKQNPEKIHEGTVLYNPLAAYYNLCEFNEKYWWILYQNPSFIDKIKENVDVLDRTDYLFLSRNPAIFTYDYDKIKETFRQLNKEVIEWLYHPKRMDLWISEIDLD